LPLSLPLSLPLPLKMTSWLSSPKIDFSSMSQYPIATLATTGVLATGALGYVVYRRLIVRRDRLPQITPLIPRIRGADTFLGLIGDIDPPKFSTL